MNDSISDPQVPVERPSAAPSRTATGGNAGHAPSAGSGAPSIALHIEHLVLDGFARNDGDRIGRALRGELTRLLAMRGTPTGFENGIALERLDAGDLSIDEDEPAERIGARLAQAIYRGFP